MQKPWEKSGKIEEEWKMRKGRREKVCWVDGEMSGKVLLGWTFQSFMCLPLSSYCSFFWQMLTCYPDAESFQKRKVLESCVAPPSSQLTLVLVGCLINHLKSSWSPLRWFIVEWWTPFLWGVTWAGGWSVSVIVIELFVDWPHLEKRHHFVLYFTIL